MPFESLSYCQKWGWSNIHHHHWLTDCHVFIYIALWTKMFAFFLEQLPSDYCNYSCNYIIGRNDRGIVTSCDCYLIKSRSGRRTWGVRTTTWTRGLPTSTSTTILRSGAFQLPSAMRSGDDDDELEMIIMMCHQLIICYCESYLHSLMHKFMSPHLVITTYSSCNCRSNCHNKASSIRCKTCKPFFKFWLNCRQLDGSDADDVNVFTVNEFN